MEGGAFGNFQPDSINLKLSFGVDLAAKAVVEPESSKLVQCSKGAPNLKMGVFFL